MSRPLRVLVVAEWYPSPADPVLGVWAHRQAVAACQAGIEIEVVALRRPVPPLAALRALAGGPPSSLPLRRWLAGVPDLLRPFELDGLTIHTAPFLAPPRPWSYGSWGLWMTPTLRRSLATLRRRWPFDLIHAHNLLPPGHAVTLAGADVPFAVSTHGPDVIRDWDRSAFARRATRSVLDRSSLLIANSRWARARCEEIAGQRLPAEVIHLGTDLPAEADLPAKRAHPTVVTVAHLVPRKRHAVVLHALAELRGEVAPEYLVIGDGPGREPLQRLARQLGIADRVHFTGQLAHLEALRESRTCHVMAMPGIEEPFGVAFVEAMAAGIPAIGSRGEGGPEDIASAGEGMVLVRPDDHRDLARAIERIFADGPERLGARARQTVAANFTWDRCGTVTAAAYRRAAGE